MIGYVLNLGGLIAAADRMEIDFPRSGDHDELGEVNRIGSFSEDRPLWPLLAPCLEPGPTIGEVSVVYNVPKGLACFHKLLAVLDVPAQRLTVAREYITDLTSVDGNERDSVDPIPV